MRYICIIFLLKCYSKILHGHSYIYMSMYVDKSKLCIYIYYSSSAYLDNISILQPVHEEKAKNRGYVEQRGVLRTNCIDCLDRTNVGQFAVG